MTSRRIGVDLGGTKIEGVVLEDGSFEPVVRVRMPTEREGGYQHVVGRVAEVVRRLRPQAPGCSRIGIGTPGALSSRDGTLKNSNTTCLNGRPLDRDLAAAIGLPVRLENDANCFALAEALGGAGQGHEVVFGVIMGTGVGGGLVLGGRLWSGPQHIAGEWGHHAIDPAGPACYCGRRGCVETLLAGPALERAHREAGGAGLAAEDVAAHAVQGDPTAVRVVATWLDHFGRALANVVSILDPDVVVLGGGLSNIAALYGDGRAAVERYVFNDELRTPIVPNRLGAAAGTLGAALLSR